MWNISIYNWRKFKILCSEYLVWSHSCCSALWVQSPCSSESLDPESNQTLSQITASNQTQREEIFQRKLKLKLWTQSEDPRGVGLVLRRQQPQRSHKFQLVKLFPVRDMELVLNFHGSALAAWYHSSLVSFIPRSKKGPLEKQHILTTTVGIWGCSSSSGKPLTSPDTSFLQTLLQTERKWEWGVS